MEYLSDAKEDAATGDWERPESKRDGVAPAPSYPVMAAGVTDPVWAHRADEQQRTGNHFPEDGFLHFVKGQGGNGERADSDQFG